jgi:hypothetical protein
VDRVTVFVAPDGPAGGVRDVLRDLSTAGLLQPFLWVRAAAVVAARDHGGSIPAVVVAGGRQRRTVLMSELTGTPHRIVSICSLVPLVDGVPAGRSEAEPEVVSRLRARMGDARIVQVRCLLAAPGETADHDVLGRDGWHNLLVAAEDSRGPAEAHELLPRAAGPVELARHAGPVLAGVLGLWTGMTSGSLDELAVPPQGQVRLVRGFYRRVDAGAAQAGLRERVLATGTTPLPQVNGSVAVHVRDPGEACDTMVNALVRKHPEVLPRPRTAVQEITPDKLGLGQTLRWFFGFVWAALRNAPEDWFLARKRQVAQIVAKGVQRGVLGGSSSAYRVIVDRMGADGPADWYDLRAASSEAVEGFRGRPQHAAADLSELWRDFAGGALTLLDGGARDSAMPPITVGNRLGVLRSATECVPDGAGDFPVTSPQVQSRTDTERVQASDVIGAGLFRTALDRLAADPRIRDASGALVAFDDWTRRNAATYSVRFARVLDHGITSTLADIVGFVRQLEQLDGVSTDDDERVRQRRYGRRAFLATVLAVVVLAALGLVRWADRITTADTVVGCGLVVLCWAVVAFLCFTGSQRALFQALTRQQALPTQRATIEENLREAVEDLQRLCEAYGQFLVWSSVVGAVVQTPFATAPPVDDGGVTIDRGLPLSTALGRARVVDAQLDDVATDLRRGLFVSGWLGDSWEAALARPAARLGTRGPELGDADTAIFAQPSGPGSLLSVWAATVVGDRRFAVESGDRKWAGCTARAAAGGADGLAQRLLMEVDPGGGAVPAEPRARFMARVDEPPAPADARRFDAAHLAVGAPYTATAVDLSATSAPEDGLSRTAVLVELGSPAPPADFAACAGTARWDGPAGGPVF